MKYCLECGDEISFKVYEYSINKFGVPLCIEDQHWVIEMETKTTEETLKLYFALKERNVPAEIEKNDGYKTIDIAVVEAKVNIEVDGQQHNFNPHQALADLKRTYYSFKKGYLTLRIPNTLIRWNLEETADYITEFLIENLDRIDQF